MALDVLFIIQKSKKVTDNMRSLENTTVSETSKQTVRNLIRKDFDSKHYSGFNLCEFKNLYRAAIHLGFNHLAKEMNNDFITEYNTRIDE